MPEAPTVNLPLKKLLERIDKGELVLPEIQRDFVWTRKSVMLLFDSLFRGLPIGHMLVWKAKKAVQHKHFHGKRQSRIAFENFYGYLLDGQQRLTALAHVRDADDEYPLMFYTYPDRDKDDGVFEWQRDWNKKDDWYVRVADVVQGKFDRLEYLRTMKKDEYYEATQEFEARMDGDLIRLQQLLDYNIGVIEFETDEYREATELFIRFNSTGRKLSKSDLFLAELAVQVPGLATTDIQRVAHKWPGFGFTMPFLTQCLLAVFTGRLRTKAKEAWGDPDKSHASDIKNAWRRTERGLGQVIKFLTGVVKWQSADLIPSFNALVPLVVIAAEKDGIPRQDTELARRWLLLAGVRAHFSGSVHTEIDRLLRRLQDKMSVDQLWRATSRELRKLQPRDFEASKHQGSVAR